MSNAEHYQAMMLDYVYGLLEPEQVIELEVFLTTCPEGEALRRQGEEWKRKIGVAAKSEFPEVQFAPPSAKPAAAKTPPAQPVRKSPDTKKKSTAAQPKAWTRWVIAASVVLVVGGFGIPAGQQYVDHVKLAAEVNQRKAQYDRADADLRKHVSEYNRNHEQAADAAEQAAKENLDLWEEFTKKLTEAHKAVEEKQMVVVLSGPDRAQPGAPNEWRVEMFKRDGVQVNGTKVEWVVKDQSGKTVWSDEKHAPPKLGFPTPPSVSLPISFWERVKADSDLYMEVTASDDNLKAQVNARVGLARPVFVTQLATDKPLYKPGETVYFRSLTLDRATFTPPERDMQLEFRLTKPDQTTETIDAGIARGYMVPQQPNRHVIGPDKKPVRGVACGEYALDPGAAGGEYQLQVVDVMPPADLHQNPGMPAGKVLETRKFNVIEYKPELFEKTLEFDGKSYGPGDVVMVRCTASRTQGGKLKKALVRAWGAVDGHPIAISPTTTDDEGVARLKFTLPKNISAGAGSLTVVFSQNGGNGVEQEQIVRPIPVVGRVVHVDFFPEGGDLVANVPSRVYFQATTPAGKPADVKGYVTDGADVVAEVATSTDPDEPGVNRGQGVFTFTPKPGKRYFLKLVKPSGIDEPRVVLPISPVGLAECIGLGKLTGIGSLSSFFARGFKLPDVKPDGVVLTALDTVTKPDQPIRVQVQTGKSKKNLVVGAYCRGRLIDHQRVTAESGQPATVELNGSVPAGGVTRLTVFEESTRGKNVTAALDPVAERLVYRRPAQQLLLQVRPDKIRYNPGSQVKLEIDAMDESEKPAAAILMAKVVDQSVLTMADEKTGRLMPTHFLLAGEVNKPEDLEHADFLLYDPEQDRNAYLTKPERDKSAQRGVKAAGALDLLLGTQGWRRFAEQHPDRGHHDEVERLLVANGQRSRIPLETFRQEEDKVVAEYQPKLEISLASLDEKREAKDEVESQHALIQNIANELRQHRDNVGKQYREALARLDMFETKGERSRALLFGGFCLGLLGIAGTCFVIGLSRRHGARIQYFATAACSFALCSVAVVGGSMLGRSANNGIRGDEVALVPPQQRAEEEAMDLENNDPMMEMQEALAGDVKAKGEGRRKRMEEDQREALKMAAPGGFGGGGGMGRGGRPVAGPEAAAGMAQGAMAPRAPAVLKAQGKAGAMKLDDAAKRLAVDELQRADKDVAAKAARLQLGSKPGQGAVPYYRMLRNQAMEKMQQNKQMRQVELEARDFNRNKANAAAAKAALDRRAQGAARPFGFDGVKEMKEPINELERAANGLAMQQLQEMPAFFVREFKFHKQGSSDVRDQFAETVYWHPMLVLSDNGKTTIDFQLSDSISRYQVLVAGHTMDGRIGAVTTQIEARKPFTVDPKVPLEISSGDRIDVPVRIFNDSDVERTVTFKVEPNGLKPADSSIALMEGKPAGWIELPANKGGRKVISFRPTKQAGEVGLSVSGTSVPMDVSDNIVRTFRVVPEGFPIARAVSDLLEKKAFATIELPKDYVKGTLKVQVQLYPTTLADLQAGLDGLLREPSGCFEQTSTANYPNLLILDYLKASDQSKPEVAQRARAMLDRGYNALVSFECPRSEANDRRGFEWFGMRDQQHQALTAYGLLQFKDLAKVFKVDPELIKRTQVYLLDQQNANKDGFKRNERALDTFGRAPDHITNAFIVWALVESDPSDKEGMTDLLKQLEALKKQVKEHPQGKDDPYFQALVANALLQRPANGNRESALAILDRIAEKNLKNGCVDGATTSITCSGGRDLQIETTALAVLGWLRCSEPRFIKPIKESTKWIGQQRGGYGGFGSTQSTILALKALIEYTRHNKKPAEDGEYRLLINGKTFTRKFTSKDLEVITLEIEKPEEIFVPGKNDAALEITTKEAYPFSLSWSYNTLTPLGSEKCAVEVETKLDRDHAVEGETVRLDVSLRNKVKEGHGMAVAIVGLPGGARLPADLKELIKLREDGVISYFEIRGRELVLYWRSLKPEQKIDLSVSLLCEAPGEYRGPASRGYLYYNADNKHWVNPLALTIAPAAKQGDDVASK